MVLDGRYAATLLSQVRGRGMSGIWSLLDSTEDELILDRTQLLQAPPWETLDDANPADVPGIKYNYTWLANLAKFELWDRLHELQLSLPGRLGGWVYPRPHRASNMPNLLSNCERSF